MDFEKELNESQLQAVRYNDGPLLVVAGAGSGKTRVLTYKIAYLLQNGYEPWSILSLTFTNKAAREMNTRIATLVGDARVGQLWSGTFHSIFSRVLRRESAAIGFTPDYTIYDQADSRSLIKSIIKELQLDEKTYKPSHVAYRISEAKNRLVLPQAYASDASIFKRDSLDRVPEVRRIYARYVQRCRQAAAMDFDDLLLNTYLLFRDNPAIRQSYAQRFKYILVDEYQDTNFAQHQILALLTDDRSRICVVGDDAQSIYGFRGADIGNILQFTTRYPSARTVKLECNYRSTQTIVDAANSLISHNANQIRKNVYSQGETGEPIRLIDSYSDKEESLRIAGEIRKLRRSQGVGYDGMALLYRTNAQSRPFEEAFRDAAIPYRVYGGLSFYQRKEIKDIIAYFRLTCNPCDEEAFKRIVNYPARGIGATTLKKLMLAASEHQVSLWHVAAAPADYGVDINKGTLTKLQMFQQLIAGFHDQLERQDAYNLALRIIKESKLGEEFASGSDPEDMSRRENVEELLGSIKGYEEDTIQETGDRHIPLSEYLSHVSLLTDTDKEDDGQPKVTLMTVHAAKGLEFDAVFVAGMEDELFPNANAKHSPREMEEERRLFYVAITRAKRFCYLSYAKSRFKYGCTEFCEPSPFLREIDSRYLQEAASHWGSGSAAPAPSAESPRQQVPRALRPLASRMRPVAESTAQPGRSTATTASGQIAIGTTIRHERFGIGIVQAIEGSGESLKAKVEFQHAGTKNLLLKFAKFQVLEGE